MDSHIDITRGWVSGEFDLSDDGETQADLPKLAHGGIDAAVFVVFCGQLPRSAENYDRMWLRAGQQFDAIERTVAAQTAQIEIARSPADVERIVSSGKRAACVAVENGGILAKDLSRVSVIAGHGAAYITICHNGHNDICDSSQPRRAEPPEEHDGLSAFGRDVIAEMNRLGIMVDVSHASVSSTAQAVETSSAPVIASHSCCRAVLDAPRNLYDDQLSLIHESGGVVQVTALGHLVATTPPEYRPRLKQLVIDLGISDVDPDSLPEAEIDRANEAIAALQAEFTLPSVKTFVDHLEHAVRQTDISAVGIGSDFNGGGGLIGWEDVADSVNVTFEMAGRGFSEDEIAAIWGGNLLRVWRRARELASE